MNEWSLGAMNAAGVAESRCGTAQWTMLAIAAVMLVCVATVDAGWKVCGGSRC